MSSQFRVFISQRTVIGDEILPAIIVVYQEKIEEIIYSEVNEQITSYLEQKYPKIEIFNFGTRVLMPGIVDSHVHIDDPGRTHWEDFRTATKAAAAGGVTTVIDMPLNSIPPTTTVSNLEIKMNAASGNIYVDVGFWGGLVPDNINELKPMVEAGVVGFKCFLIPSATDEFKHVSVLEVENALKELQSSQTVVAFHAEFEDNISIKGFDPTSYNTFLYSRPPSMEINAIKTVALLCEKYKTRCHIVHLSANEALDVVSEAKKNGVPLTAETCYHYLTFSAEDIPNGATQFKCCPPIRTKENREILWEALKNKVLDMVVSDHSPCTEDLKNNNFIDAWGGISSLQFGLPVIWTEAEKRGVNINDVARWISTNPAKLCGLEKSKGQIKVGMDADFVVWEPETEMKVQKSDILYKNKISPYVGKTLKGKIHSTILRGNFIYKNGQVLEDLRGKLLSNSSL
ncbi:allantoinase [Chelonus insularis]|uniref:allantoinase n=1 Tax=Chelonus insularis TaxID=460826 RepID=UPI00158F6246|nr:allantoinase [Chelonus insularis]